MVETPKSGKFASKRLVAGFVVALLAVGAYWWPPSYSEIQVIPSWWVFALISVAAAMIFASRDLRQSMMIGAGVAVGAMAAIIIRVIVDVVADPTSHNLWPFELVIASLFIVPSALLGAAVGVVVRRLVPRN